MIKRKNRIMEVLPIVLFTGLLLFLSLWRVRVGMTRFFDVDEFAYFHWAADVARGMVPYRDFFLIIPPMFVWVFSLVIPLAGIGPQVFEAGRMVAIVIFFVMLGLVAVLFGQTRSWRWAILAAVIFAFLPMPYDKLLELRPDNLASLLALAGLVLETELLTGTIKRYTPFAWALTGFFYSASLLVLPKTLPFVAVGGLVPFFFSLVRSPNVFRWEHWKTFVCFCAGLVFPLAIFFVWLVSTGSFSTAWYSVTRLPFEVYLKTPWAPMEPNLFFYPNSSFYGGTGHEITLGMVVNHALWILAIAIGVYRVVTPLLTSQIKRTNMWVELLIGGTFILSIIGYVKFFPLRHAQYLIPISIFIAYYAADGLGSLFDWLSDRGGGEALVIIITGFLYLLVVSANQTNTPKLWSTNTPQLQSIDRLLATVPRTDRIFDLEGRMIFWKDAYYICCEPFSEIVPSMSRKPEPFTDVLERDKIPYIFFGESGRLAAFSESEYAYIVAHYAAVAGWGQELWKRK